MSNITKNLNIYKDVTNLIGARSFGKEDLVVPYKQLNATIIDSPTVTENFIVKGFTSSSKLRVSNQGAYTDNVKFFFKLSFGSDISSTQEFMWNYTGNNSGIGSNSGSWRIWVGSGVTGTSIKSNTTYWVCVNQDSSGTKLYTIEHNGTYSKENLPKDLSQWVLSASTSTTVFGNNDYCYGGSTVTTGEYWRSSIDMNNCWIEIDGVEVWRGVKVLSQISRNDMQNYVLDGIDVQPVINDNKAVIDFSNVKLPWKFEHSDRLLTSRFAIAPYGTTVTQPKYVKKFNVTKVGSPTVTEDFVASGFGTNKYFTYTLQEALGNDYEVLLKFHTSNTAQSGGQVILSLADGKVPTPEMQNIYIAFTNNGATVYAKTGNGSTNTLAPGGALSVQNNTDYYIKLVSNPSSTTFYASTTGFTNMTMVDTVNASLSLTNKLLKFGYDVDNTQKSYFKGSIDFKECSIKKNGVEIWRGDRVATEEMETLSGCVRYYYGEGEHVTTPPRDSTQYYNIYAVNGDEGIVLDSTYFHEGTMVYNRPIVTGGEIPQFENEWYLGEYRVETGEEGYIYIPIDKPDTVV